MTLAEGYIALVLAYVTDLPITQHELQDWWVSEAGKRRDYGLTEEQEEDLFQHCRTMLWQLPVGGPAPAPAPAKKNARPSKSRYAI